MYVEDAVTVAGPAPTSAYLSARAGSTSTADPDAADRSGESVTIDAEYDAEPVSIAVKPTYLLDGLGSLDTPYVLMRYPEKTRPVVLSGLVEPGAAANGSFSYLFIPVRSVA